MGEGMKKQHKMILITASILLLVIGAFMFNRHDDEYTIMAMYEGEHKGQQDFHIRIRNDGNHPIALRARDGKLVDFKVTEKSKTVYDSTHEGSKRYDRGQKLLPPGDAINVKVSFPTKVLSGEEFDAEFYYSNKNKEPISVSISVDKK